MTTTRHSGRWLLLGLALLLIGVGIAAALRLRGVQSDLTEVRDILVAAGEHVEQGELQQARDALARAEAMLLAANNTLASSPELEILGYLPVAQENLAAVQDAVALAYRLASGGASLLQVAQDLEGPDGRARVPMEAGTIPLGDVAEAARRAEQLAASLPVAGAPRDDSFLLGRVVEVRNLLYDEAIARRAQLEDLGQGLSLLAEMAGANGPRRYLIAVANTAEMRGTGGMILSYGVLESEQGRFTLAQFGPIDELFLDAAVDPSILPVAEDEAARWSGLEPTRLWRNANLVPDFAVAGGRLETMYETASGLEADGVIQIDAHGLAAILRAVGPVEVPGAGTVAGDDVVDLALNQLYFVYEDEDEQRREILGDIAEAAFDRLVSDDLPSLRPLAEEIVEAAEQRHILFTSSNQGALRPIRFFATDGPLPAFAADARDALLLTVQNFGRDKLDYYLESAVTVTGSRVAGETGRLQVAISLTNTAPAGQDEPLYVFGDGALRPADAEPGTYVGTASLYLPVGAEVVGSTGDGTVSGLGSENRRPVVGIGFEVPPGQTHRAVLELELPTRPVVEPTQVPATLSLVPFPRVRPTTWNIDVETGTGAIRREGPLLVPELVVESGATG